MKKKIKYELLKDDFKTLPDGRKLYRIRALIDVRPSVPAGTLGGYIESGLNLSQEGAAWVYDEAMVYDEACVLNDVNNNLKLIHFFYKSPIQI